MPYDKISTYFKENRTLVLVLCIADFLFNALMCLIPLAQGRAIDAFADGVAYSELIKVAAAFIGLVLFVQINRYVKRYLGRSFGNRIALRMRLVSYENLVNREMSYFQNVSRGDILNKILADIADASDGITLMTTECFDTIVLLAGYLVTMLWMDVHITAIVMLLVLFSILSTKVLKKIIYKYTMEYKEYLSRSKDLTLTCLSNELSYRGFGVSGIYRQLYEESQTVLEMKSRKAMILQACLEPIYSILTWLGLFFIVWIGGKRVLAGTLDIGMFSAFMSTYLLVAAKVSRIGRVYGWYQNLRVSWVRCKPYLGRKTDGRADFVQNEAAQGMCLRAVDFSYGFDEQFHLPKMSFALHSGQIVGVCGRVHTGKSTLLAALSGLYEYEGSLTLNGQELSRTRCPVGYVSADNLVFEDTLLYNVTLGKEGDSGKAFRDSALDADIAQMEKKEQQKLTHGLVNLSGGQQKRLLLARALFHSPALILLDDPFQSIDRLTVEKIMGNLRTYRNSIIVIVTNQEFLLQQMDVVIRLEEGGYQMEGGDPA